MKRLVLLMPVVVLAALLFLPVSGWGWTQSFTEGYGTFDFDSIYVKVNPSYSTLVEFSYLSDGWSATPQGASATASGSTVKKLSFDLNFSTAKDQSFTFEFYTYLTGNLVNYATAEWTGTAWKIEPPDLAAVPLPGALLLFGTGLVGLAVSRRRRLQG